MTRPAHEVEAVAALFRLDKLRPGLMSEVAVGRRTGIPRSTVRDWRRRGFDVALGGMRDRAGGAACKRSDCQHRLDLDAAEYAYLLGMYLGDGHISAFPRRVYRLRITCCLDYPVIMEECAAAMRSVLPNRVGRVMNDGCLDLYSFSKHWPCLLPQHGPGRKHERPIVLEPWQRAFALDQRPDRFVRGLIHSDGCRVINGVVRPVSGTSKRYEYVRYQFSNRSADIKALFIEACARLGVAARPSNQVTISVSRRDSVAILERIVGAKR